MGFRLGFMNYEFSFQLMQIMVQLYINIGLWLSVDLQYV